MTMRLTRAVLCAMGMLASQGATMAEPGDAETIKACVSAAEMPASCIGKISVPCKAKPEAQTTDASLACVDRETEAWDALLSERYDVELTASTTLDTDLKAVPGAVFQPVAESLITAQRAWEAFRDAECQRRYNLFQSGSYRLDAQAECLMELTAARALDITVSND